MNIYLLFVERVPVSRYPAERTTGGTYVVVVEETVVVHPPSRTIFVAPSTAARSGNVLWAHYGRS